LVIEVVLQLLDGLSTGRNGAQHRDRDGPVIPHYKVVGEALLVIDDDANGIAGPQMIDPGRPAGERWWRLRATSQQHASDCARPSAQPRTHARTCYLN